MIYCCLRILILSFVLSSPFACPSLPFMCPCMEFSIANGCFTCPCRSGTGNGKGSGSNSGSNSFNPNKDQWTKYLYGGSGSFSGSQGTIHRPVTISPSSKPGSGSGHVPGTSCERYIPGCPMWCIRTNAKSGCISCICGGKQQTYQTTSNLPVTNGRLTSSIPNSVSNTQFSVTTPSTTIQTQSVSKDITTKTSDRQSTSATSLTTPSNTKMTSISSNTNSGSNMQYSTTTPSTTVETQFISKDITTKTSDRPSTSATSLTTLSNTKMTSISSNTNSGSNMQFSTTTPSTAAETQFISKDITTKASDRPSTSATSLTTSSSTKITTTAPNTRITPPYLFMFTIATALTRMTTRITSPIIDIKTTIATTNNRKTSALMYTKTIPASTVSDLNRTSIQSSPKTARTSATELATERTTSSLITGTPKLIQDGTCGNFICQLDCGLKGYRFLQNGCQICECA